MTHPFLCMKIFDTRYFLKHRRIPYEVFRYCDTKNCPQQIVVPPLMHKIFRSLNFLKHRRVPLRNISVLWDKKFTTKMWYPLLSIKIFDTRSFLKHRKVSLRILFVLWDKKIVDRIVILLSIKFLDTRKWNTEGFKGSPMKFFGTVRRKIFDGKSWYPPPSYA